MFNVFSSSSSSSKKTVQKNYFFFQILELYSEVVEFNYKTTKNKTKCLSIFDTYLKFATLRKKTTIPVIEKKNYDSTVQCTRTVN